MRCSKAQEYLSMEIDGVLPPDATGKLRDHLDGCGGCSEYRQDLLLGSRMLGATAPELSDNFEWKLQLRLNQALKESVGEVAYPWSEKESARWAWIRNFGTAASLGLAAVLAVAVFLGPVVPADNPSSSALEPTLGADRLPLERGFSNVGTPGRMVSTGSPFQNINSRPRVPNRSWSGDALEDLRTINGLRSDNENLHRMLVQTQRQMQLMRAQLDSTRDNALDLHQDR